MRQDVCKFLTHTLQVGVCSPLEVLEQLARFNSYALGEVIWGVELRSIALRSKCHECVVN
jgi:hypothetical protein